MYNVDEYKLEQRNLADKSNGGSDLKKLGKNLRRCFTSSARNRIETRIMTAPVPMTSHRHRDGEKIRQSLS
jgi:hypothetical protein